ncbi:PDR/VanB family oxidoreductase [Methylobacterium sp. CB376]|uniref:PDR/VanB family oxidoreductase n=1 Tax=unclassified Methylobacterium TaxID=2615210 RepID=UPI0003265A4E|nr:MULTISPECIES: PDR/VanB family oxidoreductase [Methylobacterium]WFT78370.1 PDR/VanB family oxidoreductase [Methylobacterium nodulans]
MTARLIMKLRVATAEAATPQVRRVVLVHPRRPDLPAWEAGAHVALHLPDGRVRAYSLCGDPADRSRYEIAIKREEAGRGGSVWAHDALRPGAIVPVAAPRSAFRLAGEARHHVLVGGGIGVTPLLAMARTLAAEGADFALHLCARSAGAAPLLGEAEAVCGGRLRRWFSAEGRRFDPAVLAERREGSHLYLCGPESLIEAARRAAAAHGWPPASVHVERFAPAAEDRAAEEPFVAVIGSTGQEIEVPAGLSLLAALRARGFSLPSSCETGLCGACACGYREGTVLHRDAALSPAARTAQLTPCVSRARGRVVLAL